jgi:hypothetical protein
MTDQATTTPAAPKPLTVAEDMDARRIFPSVEEAAAYLAASAERFTDFGDIPLAMPGLVKDEEGNVVVNEESGQPETDPAIYTESVDVMVALLRKQKGGVKAIVVAPIPKISVLQESESGQAWVGKILHKELNHVAVRHLRDAEDVLSFVDQMPTTIEGYISSERGVGGIMETFDALYKGIDAALSTKLPVWSKARFIKSELKKALESKGYASEFYPALEDYKGQSLFEAALDIGVNAAKRKGLDPTIFERWKSTRNAKTYTPGEDEDEDELNLDSLTDALLEAEKPADATPSEEAAPAAAEPEAEDSEAPAEATA